MTIQELRAKAREKLGEAYDGTRKWQMVEKDRPLQIVAQDSALADLRAQDEEDRALVARAAIRKATATPQPSQPEERKI